MERPLPLLRWGARCERNFEIGRPRPVSLRLLRRRVRADAFLFTDLKGSTELYERVGDLAAFDLVRAHFRVLQDVVASEGGAVVKTIGDAVMATFPTPDRALAAALRMREAIS